MSSSSPARRVVRVRHELQRREVEVVGIESLSPGFVEVTFAGESLADFVSQSFDDHVKFLFPEESGQTVGRDYTPRRFSQAERRLTIEFAMHGAGSADQWARQAAVGQRVAVGGPRGSMIIPTDFDWHLLAGDAAALPAIARRLEELPEGARVMAIVQAPEADRRDFTGPGGLAVEWVATAEELVSAVRRLQWPAGEGFVWAAGEAAAMKRLRQVLLDEKQHPREAMRVAAYWKQGASAHHANLDD